MDDPFGLWLVEGVLLILVFLFSLAHTALKNANENKKINAPEVLQKLDLKVLHEFLWFHNIPLLTFPLKSPFFLHAYTHTADSKNLLLSA